MKIEKCSTRGPVEPAWGGQGVVPDVRIDLINDLVSWDTINERQEERETNSYSDYDSHCPEFWGCEYWMNLYYTPLHSSSGCDVCYRELGDDCPSCPFLGCHHRSACEANPFWCTRSKITYQNQQVSHSYIQKSMVDVRLYPFIYWCRCGSLSESFPFGVPKISCVSRTSNSGVLGFLPRGTEVK